MRQLFVTPAVGLVLGLALLATGCGREPDAAQTTPEGLLATYDEVTMQGPIVDPRAVLALVRSENDRQHRIVETIRASIPILELEQALWDRFGEGIDPNTTRAPLAPRHQPARLTARTDGRAAARVQENDGSTTRLFLLEADGRWWISAHTYESDPRLADPRQLDRIEQMNRYLGAVADDIRARLEDGEFANAAEAGFAAGQAMAERFPELGAKPEQLLGAAE